MLESTQYPPYFSSSANRSMSDFSWCDLACEISVVSTNSGNVSSDNKQIMKSGWWYFQVWKARQTLFGRLLLCQYDQITFVEEVCFKYWGMSETLQYGLYIESILYNGTVVVVWNILTKQSTITATQSTQIMMSVDINGIFIMNK